MAVKTERDEAVNEKDDEAMYGALFMDRQMSQIDALKALCASHGVPQDLIDKALAKKKG